MPGYDEQVAHSDHATAVFTHPPEPDRRARAEGDIDGSEPVRYVSGELDQLAKTIEQLESTLGYLAKQLVPILRPATPTDTTSDRAQLSPQPASDLAENIRARRKHVAVLISHVGDLRNRLDLPDIEEPF